MIYDNSSIILVCIMYYIWSTAIIVHDNHDIPQKCMQSDSIPLTSKYDVYKLYGLKKLFTG